MRWIVTIVRVGTNAKYAQGWEQAFGGKKAASSAPKAAAKKAAKKAPAPKKKAAKKKSGKK